ncbi:MAG TPA: phosphoethanolamine transferase EptA, partial [Atlantibacter hermannii]|nr:phosphoethanolamine transferase EptA [Atlantibacter hermannii]
MSFPRLKRPTLSRTQYLCLFSAYISLCLNLAFYHQVLSVFPLNTLRNIMVFITMPVVIFCVINSLASLASLVKLDRLVIALLILLSASAQYFILTYGIVMDRSMIANMLDTTASETFALLTPQMALALVFSGVLMAMLALWVRVKDASSWRRFSHRLLSVIACVAVVLVVAALFYKDYASLFRNNKELVKAINPSNTIAASWSWYVHNRDDNLPLVKIGEDARQNPLMRQGKKNLTIVIVGETSRADDFSLGGYGRPTNPQLAQQNVVYFPHTTSCGTATAISVPCMFSNMPRAHYDEGLAHHQEGVLDIIQRAGIQVLWNENDGG